MSFDTDANNSGKSQEELEKEELIEEVKKSLEALLLAEHLNEDEKVSAIEEALAIVERSKKQ